MFDPLMIVCALLCGLLARSVGLPALVGYLAAGFVLHELGATEGILLSQLANMGVTLLLFSIGLKLRPVELLAPRVWGTTLAHMGVTMLALAPMLMLCAALWLEPDALSLTGAIVVAFALSFSSMVFAIQVLQERGNPRRSRSAFC